MLRCELVGDLLNGFAELEGFRSGHGQGSPDQDRRDQPVLVLPDVVAIDAFGGLAGGLADPLLKVLANHLRRDGLGWVVLHAEACARLAPDLVVPPRFHLLVEVLDI